MCIHRYRIEFGIPALVLLLNACAHTAAPEQSQSPTAATPDVAAVLWSVGSRPYSFQERGDHAIVTRINDKKITEDNPPRARPLELPPGQYTVDILYEKDLFIQDFGPAHMKDAPKPVALTVEAGHSYSPQATRRCGKTWRWIEDWGQRVPDDIAAWRNQGSYHYEFQAKSGVKRVVAGAAPPAACDEEQN